MIQNRERKGYSVELKNSHLAPKFGKRQAELEVIVFIVPTLRVVGT